MIRALFYQNLDSTTYLVGFKNGVYDFKKHEFRTGRETDYITFSTGYDFVDYDPDAKETKEIYEFLQKIIPNKRVLKFTLKELVKALLELQNKKFKIKEEKNISFREYRFLNPQFLIFTNFELK